MSDRFQPGNDAWRHETTDLVEPKPLRRQCPLVAEAAERWSVTRLRESLWKGFRGKPRRRPETVGEQRGEGRVAQAQS